MVSVAALHRLEHGAVVYYLYMTKLLQDAISEITNLREADQEEIGRKLLSHIEKLHRLRAEIDKGIRSLDRGGGRELDIEDFIQQAHARHGTAQM
jgi:hypothetical protein